MEVGSHWKEWEVTELVGAGSFGKVYKITRTGLNNFKEESALKVIRIPQNASDYQSALSEGMDDESVSAYFESIVSELSNEFALMSRLKGNTNIVSFEDYEVVKIPDDFGWEIFIRMEFLTPLTTYIAQNTITVKDVARIGADICRALELCEREKIIHRDIKPENIFVSAHGDYKLGDFGIAKRLENVSVSLTKKGTLSYMAPEVYKGQPYTSSVDLYSLGIVLYRLLNYNRNPFMPPYPERIHYNDREEARLRRMSGEEMAPPANAPEDFAKVILKACAYDPADRFPDAKSMRLAIESVISGDEEQLKLYLENLPDPEKATVTIVDDNKSKAKQTAGKRKPLIIGGAAAALVAVIVAVVVLSGGMSGSDKKVTIYERLSGSAIRKIVDAADQAVSAVGSEGTGDAEVSTDLEFPDYDGSTVTVSNADELRKAVSSASSGTTIELEEGNYGLGTPLIVTSTKICLKGKGSSKPVLDSMIQLDASEVMIDNISISIDDAANTTTSEEDENSGILCQGGNAYIRDTDIRLSYTSESIKVGVTGYSPVTMSGCTIDVTSSEGNSHTGIFTNSKLYASGNTITAGNGIGIDVYSDADGMSEDELKTIVANNTINAYSKVNLQQGSLF